MRRTRQVLPDGYGSIVFFTEERPYVPIYQRLVNHNLMFSRLTTEPIIINDVVNSTREERERLKDLITTRYVSVDTDNISMAPACNCRYLTGEFLLNVTCDRCGTPVKPVLAEDIEPIVWLRRPIGVEPLINPVIWIMLSSTFKVSGFNLIRWFADASYQTPVKQPAIIQEFINHGIVRGYNTFVQNFDFILERLASMKIFRKKERVQWLMRLISEYRDCIFSDYLPVPNRTLLVIEKTPVGRFLDDATLPVMVDAVLTLSSIDTGLIQRTLRDKEIRTIRAITGIARFYDTYFKNDWQPKPGLLRKHIFGTRTIYSFRCVISSLTRRHAYDEIHIPWSVALVVFRQHLLNYMLRMPEYMSRSQSELIGILYSHIDRYNATIDQIFQTMIANTTDGRGFYCIMQRNPSLLQGSAQLTRITHVKTNPRDPTVSRSILTTRNDNADKIMQV